MRCSHKVNAEVVREALVLRLAHDEQRAATAKGAPALEVVRSVLPLVNCCRGTYVDCVLAQGVVGDHKSLVVIAYVYIRQWFELRHLNLYSTTYTH